MSVTISSPTEICKAPYNNSTAKMQYSFSKDNRFKNNKENMQALIKHHRDRPYYKISSQISKRATNFGYGTKYDFTKDMPKTPPPGAYEAGSNFEKGISTKKGFGFGNSRENMIVTGPLAETRNNKNPGPGSYEIPSTKSQTYYSLKGKVQDKLPEKTPGPGNYEINPTLNRTGSNFFSKFKDHRAMVFSNSSERFKRPISGYPGPGNYTTVNTEINKEGRYSLSKMSNSKVRSFGSSARKSLNEKSETPGPGNYRMPSDFGYYANRRSLNKDLSVSKLKSEQSKHQTIEIQDL